MISFSRKNIFVLSKKNEKISQNIPFIYLNTELIIIDLYLIGIIMYLNNIMKNNPQLLETIFDSHQKGLIPPNTWVIDLDTIADNAIVLSNKAKELDLNTYLMSKQHNRNPYINKLALALGLEKLVAVDIQGVLAARKYNMPLGHAGHLNQIPRQFIPLLVSMKPEIITIYNLEHAKWVNEAAEKLGLHQELMIRIFDEGDICFDGQEGGFLLSEIPSLVLSIKDLKNVSITGVTAFPCVTYNESSAEKVELTSNIKSIHKAARILEKMGLNINQINTPGNTASSTMKLLKENGATHVEPGNSLIGTTPNNAFFPDMEEKTAFAYVTEISHFYKNTAFAYGGGVYHTNYSDKIYGLVGTDYSEAKGNKIEYDFDIKQDIDYHMQLKPKAGQRCKVGDSAVFAYRTQMHMTRSYVLPISGISGKRELKLHYLFDNANNAFDTNYEPVLPSYVCSDIDELIKSYA
jgi:predicted amino acid racemase